LGIEDEILRSLDYWMECDHFTNTYFFTHYRSLRLYLNFTR
jgi:hypothetical protein